MGHSNRLLTSLPPLLNDPAPACDLTRARVRTTYELNYDCKVSATERMKKQKQIKDK